MTTMLDRSTLDAMTLAPPGAPQWAPEYPQYPPPRPESKRRVPVLTLLVGAVATAALVVGIVSLADRPAAPAPSPAPAGPAYSAADQAAAKQHVCSTFADVVDAVRTATNAPSDVAEPIATSVNGRAALATGALAMSRSVTPATPPDVAEAATKLADTYSAYLLSAFTAGKAQQNDADHAAVLAASKTMRGVCGM